MLCLCCTEEHVVDAEYRKQQQKTKSKEQISKYRELLKGIQDKEKKVQEGKDMEMEVTWVPGTSSQPWPCNDHFLVPNRRT